MEIDRSWIPRLRKADIVCTHCKDSWNNSKSGSWRFTGEHWEHHCSDAKEGKYFIAIMRKQLREEKNV